MSTPVIHLLDSNALSISLMNVIGETFSQADFARMAQPCDPKVPGSAVIRLTLNGVEVPDPIGNLTKMLNAEMGRIDQRASELALEMVSKAGLDGIEDALHKVRETMEQADWALRDTLRTKAGATFHDR